MSTNNNISNENQLKDASNNLGKEKMREDSKESSSRTIAASSSLISNNNAITPSIQTNDASSQRIHSAKRPRTGANITIESNVVTTSTSATSGNEYATNSSSCSNEQQQQQQLQQHVTHSQLPTIGRDVVKMCGSCIFCRMPPCERCFGCSSLRGKSVVGGEDEMQRRCLLKTCCNIPIEFKLHPMDKLGFPKGWCFTFDDPQKMSLVPQCTMRRQILPIAGLKILSPDKQVFHSLQSAFAYMSLGNPSLRINDVTDMLENFLVHVGSTPRVPYPGHFLVGKNYCMEFTNNAEEGSAVLCNNVTLFGKMVACMRQQPSTTSSASNFRTSSKDDSSFFIVQYDKDALAIAKKKMGGKEVPSIQLINSEMAWGGCISYERKTCCRRDANTAIQNIDQATALETWVAPDMRMEDTVEQPDGTSLPRLTVFSRGYKFVFGVQRNCVANDSNGNQQQLQQRQCGVYASCISLQGGDDTNGGHDQEINLKPGELIDLGVYSPLRVEDAKSLPSFLVKNYIHQLKPGRWAITSGLKDNIVHDLTDDRTGELHVAASKHLLSYIRKRTKGQRPTIHARHDPSGQVHLLFGIPYEGNWEDYEGGMQQLVPLFCGRTVEVTMSRQSSNGLLFGGKRKGGAAKAERKLLQSIGMFQTEDIAACNEQLSQMFVQSPDLTKEGFTAELIERSIRALKCLEERQEKLIEVLIDAKSQKVGRWDDLDKLESTLASTLEHSRRLARILEHTRKNYN